MRLFHIGPKVQLDVLKVLRSQKGHGQKSKLSSALDPSVEVARSFWKKNTGVIHARVL
jgi:L-fucose mutarotase/ribose pyranase (RbsD/FucU family)